MNALVSKSAVAVAALFAATAFTACETSHHIIVEQTKPLDINVNLSGRIELVITDARKDVEKITGEKPKRIVNPQDIGLPPELDPGSALPAPRELPPRAAALPASSIDAPALLLADVGTPPKARAVDTADAIKQSLAARNGEVMKLLDAKLAGEAHSGLLVARGALSAAQQTLLAAENKDRQALYEAEAKSKSSTVDKVAIAYYLARLGHINKGVWYEKYNKDANAWEWQQMQ